MIRRRAVLLIACGLALTACPKKSEPSGGESTCMSATESIKNAKPHRNAPAPYDNCAVGVFAHCGGGKGKRGSLCSRGLDEAATAEARKTTPDACCYIPAT